MRTRRVFYVARDIVYTLQGRLYEVDQGRRRSLDCVQRLPDAAGAPRRGFSAILACSSMSRRRGSSRRISSTSRVTPTTRVEEQELPVTEWHDIVKDTERGRQFVDQGEAHAAYAGVIDEGGDYLAEI